MEEERANALEVAAQAHQERAQEACRQICISLNL